MEYMQLVGAEQVLSAANTMSDAADTIRRALDNHQNFLQEWLIRLEQVLEASRSQGTAEGRKMEENKND